MNDDVTFRKFFIKQLTQTYMMKTDERRFVLLSVKINWPQSQDQRKGRARWLLLFIIFLVLD